MGSVVDDLLGGKSEADLDNLDSAPRGDAGVAVGISEFVESVKKVRVGKNPGWERGGKGDATVSDECNVGNDSVVVADEVVEQRRDLLKGGGDAVAVLFVAVVVGVDPVDSSSTGNLGVVVGVRKGAKSGKVRLVKFGQEGEM